MTTVPKPPPVTRGQKTALTHKTVEKPQRGVKTTFLPDTGPSQPGEFSPLDKQYPGLVRGANPLLDRRRDRLVQVQRNKDLREQVILAVSLAMRANTSLMALMT